jgi:dTDP-4-dehydrorhamnose reductase
MKILITGAKGMLGRTLCRRLASHDIVVFDLPEGDITDATTVNDVFQKERPAVVIHAAAMTAVDDCETNIKEAFRINRDGSAIVAEASTSVGARLIAISTDYVFDGELDRPYHEKDVPNPLTIYGKSKLAGEECVLSKCPNAAILRTAWLYGPGGPSFVHTMLRLGSETGEPVRVVNDQRGSPTSSDALASLIEQFIDRHEPGVFHATCEGEATWFDLARAVFSLKGFDRSIVPCRSDEYPKPAVRPKNSRLENRELRLKGYQPLLHWLDALQAFLKERPKE